MKASFKATTPGGVVITWDEKRGFTSPLGPALNQDLKTIPGGTFPPSVMQAPQVLLNLLPGCIITDFISIPLPPLRPGRIS